MPEGDTVRRTALELDAAFADTVIRHAELRWPSLATANLAGWRTLEVTSRGKHLLHRFDSGMTLHSHLRMDGRWSVTTSPSTQAPPSTQASARHHRIRAILTAGPVDLTAPDLTATGWALGRLDLVPTTAEHRIIGHLGPDLLEVQDDSRDDEVAHHLATAAASGPRREVAELLLDQRVLAGLGTIWVSELLFAHRTHPGGAAADVGDLVTLVHRARTGLQRSVTHGRPTAWVYGRSPRPCRRCGAGIRRWRTGEHARTIHYCPTCQPGPR